MAIHIYHSKKTRFDPGSVWCESRNFGDPAWWQHGTVCRPATSSGDCDITCLVGLVIISLPMMPLPHLVNKTMVTASGSKCISLKSVNDLLPSWSGRTCEGWCACSYLLWRALAMALTNLNYPCPLWPWCPPHPPVGNLATPAASCWRPSPSCIPWRQAAPWH